MADSYAGVYLLDAPYTIDRIYDYLVPRSLADEVRRGSFVAVPFGSGNRKRLGLVAELRDHSSFEKLKPIASVGTERTALPETFLALSLYLKEQTLCTVGDAVRAMIPAAALSKMTEVYFPAPDLPGDRCPSGVPDRQIYEYLLSRGRAQTASLQKKFGDDTDAALARLRRDGFVLRDEEYRDADAASYIPCRRLTVTPGDAAKLADGESVGALKLRSEKQRLAVRVLAENGGIMTDRELCLAVPCTPAVLRTLTEHGVLAEEQQRNLRRPYGDVPPAPPVVLNDAQEEVFRTLRTFADSAEAHAALLHGVTGSGKTSVMLALIGHLLDAGKSAIVLLPEIALTPQSIAIFCSHFGDTVAVIHSALSAGERYDAHERIRTGAARVVVGTRSAVFAPVVNLGAIIIDEEQEHTYKSDSNPKYRAHDVARFRCAKSGALLLLSSATPSLESYEKAVEGKYTLLKLKERYGRAVLPEVIIADTRGEAQAGNPSPLGELLCRELVKTRADGQQSILFLNRRGYHRFVSCRSCGAAVTCPNCSVAMTYHTRRDNFSEGELICHYCGTRLPLPRVCPTCGSEHLVRGGYGTQRVEEELRSLLPDATVLRMDTDSTASKFSYDEMLGKFRAHEADVLLGTQMVTKGHDFPDVTLVGVLSADSSLYLDDYRAGERTFALLTQVIGRAGRSELRGRAIIQTANPDHDVIRLAAAQDYETFFAREIRLRRALVFPPFCDLALVSLSCEDEKLLLLTAKQLFEETGKSLKGDFSDVRVVAFGPFEAPVYRVENKYRMRMVFKCRLNRRTREFFSHFLFKFPPSCGVLLSVDFNPTNL